MMELLKLLILLARPHFLLGGILLYALGGGIARYLGHDINWQVYILGQLWALFLQLSTQFLNEYFDAPIDENNPNRTPFSGGSGALGPDKLPRATALWGGAVCLAAVASLTVLLISSGALNPVIIMIMILTFLGAFFYAVPPVRLEATGYGELTTAIMVANLLPAFALLLQTGELHRLLAMSTFPLTTLHIAMLLAFEMPDYGIDTKYGKQTLLVRVGWQTGISLHNLMIVVSFGLLGLGLFWGLPFAIAFPAFLSMPIGFLQIWLMNRIGLGAKPNWNLLTLTAVLTFMITAYSLTFAFWTR